MPAINPNDYNIDKIDINTRDLTLGPYVTQPNFAINWLWYGHNLQNINPQIALNTSVAGAYNDLGNATSVPLLSEQVQDLPGVVDVGRNLSNNNLAGYGALSTIPLDFNLSYNYSNIYSGLIGTGLAGYYADKGVDKPLSLTTPNTQNDSVLDIGSVLSNNNLAGYGAPSTIPLDFNLSFNYPNIYSQLVGTGLAGYYADKGVDKPLSPTTPNVQNNSVLDIGSVLSNSNLAGYGSSNTVPLKFNLSRNINTNSVISNPSNFDAASLNSQLPSNSEVITDLPNVLDTGINLPNSLLGSGNLTPIEFNLSKNLPQVSQDILDNTSISNVLPKSNPSAFDSAVLNGLLPSSSENITDLDNVLDTADSPHPSSTNNASIIDYNLDKNLSNVNYLVASAGYNNNDLGDVFSVGSVTQLQPLNSGGVYGLAETDGIHPSLLGSNVYELNTEESNVWSTLTPYEYDVYGETYKTSSSQQKSLIVINSTAIGNPGSVESWKTDTGSVNAITKLKSDITDRKKLTQGTLSLYGAYKANGIKDYVKGGSLLKPEVEHKNIAYGPLNFEAYLGDQVEDLGPSGLQPYGYEFFGEKPSPPSNNLGQILLSSVGFGPGLGVGFDTYLSQVANKQRAIELENRVKLNAFGETIGKINTDPFGLLAGQPLFQKDYTITKNEGFLGKAASLIENLTGFKVPRSPLKSTETKDLLEYTGGGTRGLLYDAIITNKWGPTAKDGFVNQESEPKTKIGKVAQKIGDLFSGDGEMPKTIGYTDQITTDTVAQEEREKPLVDKINNGVKKLVDSLFKQQEKEVGKPTESENPTVQEDPTYGGKNLGFNIEFQDTTHDDEYEIDDNPNIQYNKRFKATQYTDKPELTSDKNNLFWESGNPNRAKRGLLKYTQNLIDASINDFSSAARYIGITNDDSNIAADKNNRHVQFSQGNRIKSDDVYCRSWSIRNPYSKYEDLVRHSELLRQSFVNNLSVLEDAGVVKIAPYNNEKIDWKTTSLADRPKSPSRYMLSIENLAWRGSKEFNVLPNVEKGPNEGRIMWFPPYDISFTDNSSANYETTNIIGRAEPIYTYNYTERTGTLDFTIIIDHPSSLNTIRNDAQASLEKYFAGCEDLSSTIFGDVKSEEVIEDVEPEVEKPKQKQPPKQNKETFTAYFRTATSSSSSVGRDIQVDISALYEYNQGENLNNKFEDGIDGLVDFLLTEDGKRHTIVVEAHTSCSNNKDYNKKLSEDRADSVKDYIYKKLVTKEAEVGEVKVTGGIPGKEKTYPTEDEMVSAGKYKRWQTISLGEQNCGGGDTADEPKDRKVVVKLIVNSEMDAIMDDKPSNETQGLSKQEQVALNARKDNIVNAAKKVANEMVNEATYFRKIQETDSFVYDSLKEKVQFFHPAFHSMTPEGFNSRLTFLKQCTRQGPSIGGKDEPDNMAFGKPPICVLRIGDFYHTKIVVDTVNFTFDPLQWDLNPEGIGVQPMLCKVSLSFKFIGGSSLGGPISQLQNAVSYNFFANTSVYNKRRVKTYQTEGAKDGNGKDKVEFGSYLDPDQVSNVKDIAAGYSDTIEELAEQDVLRESEVKGKESGLSDEEKKAIEENDNKQQGKPDDAYPNVKIKKQDDLSSPIENTQIQYKEFNINIQKPNGKWVVLTIRDEDGKLNKYGSDGAGGYNYGVPTIDNVTKDDGTPVTVGFIGGDSSTLTTDLYNEDDGNYVIKITVQEDVTGKLIKKFTESFTL